MIIQFGKYKGTKINQMVSQEQVKYLQWLYQIANKKMKDEILKHINNSYI